MEIPLYVLYLCSVFIIYSPLIYLAMAHLTVITTDTKVFVLFDYNTIHFQAVNNQDNINKAKALSFDLAKNSFGNIHLLSVEINGNPTAEDILKEYDLQYCIKNS